MAGEKTVSAADLNVAVDAVAPTLNTAYSVNTSYSMARALYIGGDGNVSLVTPAGVTVSFVGLKAGSILPVAHTKVNTSSTTATNLVALF